MTAPIWSDGHGLRVRKTTSSEYYFLDVREDSMLAMRPFMELDRVGAIQLPESKSSEDRGWLIPANMFDKLKPFLTHFYLVLPYRGRDQYYSGLEHTPLVERKSSRAGLYYLTFQKELSYWLSSLRRHTSPVGDVSFKRSDC